MANIVTVWKPQPQQVKFMQRPEYEVLYGGAAGGGKSDALVAEALRQVANPSYQAVIIRKTYPQLAELIRKSLFLYPRVCPKAKFNDSKHMWSFPSGAKIFFKSMNNTNAKMDFQGQAYDFVGFDELTHFTLDEYMWLLSRNRPNGPGTRVYIRSTTNPGGVGHGWVKARFITPAPPLTPITEILKVVQPDGSILEMPKDRIFVPATVFDNKILLENDPTYLANLALMSEKQKNALLYGNWDSFDGQVFTEWRNDKERYADRTFTHVIEPFIIPDNWRIYRGFDWGYSKPFSVGWYAVDNDGRLYRLREYYGCTGTPNEGLKMTAKEVAKKIKEIEESDRNLKGKSIFGIADPAIFAENGGTSIADDMAKEGVYWNKADHTRIAGKMQCHYRLAFDNDGLPMFYVFNTCKHFIRTIPDLVYDEANVEDINTDQEDHIYDEWRYICMENPIKSRKDVLTSPSNYDPLDIGEETRKYNRFNFYKY